MSKGVHKPKERDIRRAIRAATKSGLTGFEIAIDPRTGEIKILSAHASLVPADPEEKVKGWSDAN